MCVRILNAKWGDTLATARIWEDHDQTISQDDMAIWVF